MDQGSRLLKRFGLALILLLTTIAAIDKTAEDFRVRIGAATFRTYCANCHGTEGKGDGQVSKYLRVKPTDLTTLTSSHEGKFPAEDVFKAIDGREFKRTHGSKEMPIWGDAFVRPGPDSEANVQRKIDELVAFVRSIQK